MAEQSRITIAVIGVDIGKNSFHVVGLECANRARQQARAYRLGGARQRSRF
jgi:hypothetical protein